jgi:hypothetical protein
MKMKSMKMSPQEKKKMNPEVQSNKTSGPEFPYGLRITLDSEAISKLGITKLPSVGGTIMLEAKAKIVGVSQNEREGSKRKSMELQITDLGIGQEDDTAEKIYK